ncbi:MAG TPA: DUF72 domain-containing protein [Phenylobacterium sp.]|jgi:uncharacterized protein YecE (DUF72 family)
MVSVRIGTAGWTIPRAVADAFPAAGSGLERYAARFRAAEINSTFYRQHRPATFARWREATPPAFRFALKLPRALTHEARLTGCEPGLDAFLEETDALGEKRGPLLAQLPPKLAFQPDAARSFFSALRERYSGAVACEPRHPSWFEPDAERLLEGLRVGRVAADPLRHPLAGTPGGWPGLAYWRLHGSPRMYYSAYDEAALQGFAAAMASSPAEETWCVFDKTTSGAAAADALRLSEIVSGD